jgi:hypothetical protein
LVWIFLFQVGDPLLLGGVVALHLLFERRPNLEEFLLPAGEDRRLESTSSHSFENRLLVRQMPPQDGDLLFRRVVLPLLLHAFAPFS